MRVLHVIPSVSERDGGPAQAVLAMARWTARAGEDVLVAATDAGADVPKAGTDGTFIEREGVRIVLFPLQWSDRVKVSLPLARWLRRRVADFDVVHAHAVFSHACRAAARICRRKGVPYGIRPLGSLDPWSLSRHSLRKRAFLRFGGRRAIGDAAFVHYTSDREREGAERRLGLANGVVVPLGVETAPERPPRDAGGPREILFLSRLDPKKRPDVLIRAIGELKRRGALDGVRTTIAGDGDSSFVRDLVALADSVGAGDAIRFAGWVAGEAKADALRRADLFVLPSAQENFGAVVVEAMAAGVAVIVSPEIDLAPEIARERLGWLAAPEPRALADAISGALAEDAEREERGARGRRHAAREYSWPAVAERLVALHRSAAGRAA